MQQVFAQNGRRNARMFMRESKKIAPVLPTKECYVPKSITAESAELASRSATQNVRRVKCRIDRASVVVHAQVADSWWYPEIDGACPRWHARSVEWYADAVEGRRNKRSKHQDGRKTVLCTQKV